MFDWLFDGIEELGLLVVNGLIQGFALVLSGFVAILPSMPALPTMPTAFTTAYAWVAWFFPVNTLLALLASVLAFWLIWQVVVIALRWAKAVNE